MSLTPMFQAPICSPRYLRTQVGLFWCTGAVLAGWPSWRDQWLVWSTAGLELLIGLPLYVAAAASLRPSTAYHTCSCDVNTSVDASVTYIKFMYASVVQQPHTGSPISSRLHDHWTTIPGRTCEFNKLCGRPPQYAPAPCKLTFDILTLKVVSESRVTWPTSVPIQF